MGSACSGGFPGLSICSSAAAGSLLAVGRGQPAREPSAWSAVLRPWAGAACATRLPGPQLAPGVAPGADRAPGAGASSPVDKGCK